MKKEDMIEQKLEELQKVTEGTGCSREELLTALLMGGDHRGC